MVQQGNVVAQDQATKSHLGLIVEIREFLADSTYNIGVSVLVLIVYIAVHLYKKKQKQLNLFTILVLFYSSYSIMSGLAILLVSIDKSAQLIKGLEPTAYAAAGISAVYIGIKEINDKFEAI